MSLLPLHNALPVVTIHLEGIVQINSRSINKRLFNQRCDSCLFFGFGSWEAEHNFAFFRIGAFYFFDQPVEFAERLIIGYEPNEVFVVLVLYFQSFYIGIPVIAKAV